MKPFRNRKIDPAKPVDVYRNLNRGGYSVVQGRLVVAHVESITLSSCTMHVSEWRRQRVVARKRKEVHAVVKGYIAQPSDQPTVPFTYNPYKAAYFHTKDGVPVHSSSYVRLNDCGAFCAID
jgi:hypothetical protein